MTRRVRPGFTLIELLVVMGIITVLVGLAVLAYMHLQKAPAEGLTRTRLQMCANILSEYDPEGNLLGIEGAGGWAPASGQQQSVYFKAANATATASCASPGDVTFGSGSRANLVTPATPVPTGVSLVLCPSGTSSNYVYPNAVQATAAIFQLFSRIPDVKSQLAQLPGNALLQANTGGGTGGPWLDASNRPLPVILDGWKNPIIYVPTGGLANVYVGGPQNTTGATTGIWGTPKTVTSVDGRPFWASAGADGNFSTGDDNVYSCPVKYQ